jgi:hypothetical protein
VATENIKDFAIQWVLFGLLFLSLLTFATTFIANNNPDALGDTGDNLGIYQENMTSNLVIIESTSDDTLTILSQNDPEVSNQGSSDSVASAFKIRGVANTIISSFKLFFGYIFTGLAGQILISTFVGMFGLLSAYYIYKSIRNGL